MRELLWRLVARIVCIQRVTKWLIARSKRTPYTPISSRDGKTIYMRRWWLFNPYPPSDGEDTRAEWAKRLPSVRVHWIARPDDDVACHDHPWNARTVVMLGWYDEERPAQEDGRKPRGFCGTRVMKNGTVRDRMHRQQGYTGRLLFGQYHRISGVSPSGVFTLFITWRKRGTWGFDVDGQKVPWREYLGLGGEA